jgi:hypothetical protein
VVTDDRTTRRSLGRAERMAVMVLCRLLPVGIRSRQRDEWTADLLALADNGARERCRYLFWAGWTLPALYAAARRGGIVGADGPSTVVGASGAVTMLPRIVLIGLGWPVITWLVAVPGHYWLNGVLGHEVTAEPHGWLRLVLLVPMLILVGVYAAMPGGPFLVGSLGLAAILVGLTRRGENRRLRATAILAGVAAAAFSLSVAFSTTYNWLIASDSETGYSTGAVGAAAVVLGLAARRLSLRTRITLALIGLGGVAVLVVQHTATGAAMRFWFYD